MANTKNHQENRRGLTIRLAKQGEMQTSECFSQEQMAELESLLPDVPTSRIVQMALLHYSKVLPDLLIKEQEEKLQNLRNIKTRLENGVAVKLNVEDTRDSMRMQREAKKIVDQRNGVIGRGLTSPIIHCAYPWDGAGAPPLNDIIMASDNKGDTWFPIRLLWIGEKTFVWRNMCEGTSKVNEKPMAFPFTNWCYRPFVDGMELRTYYRDKETPDVWERFKLVS